MIGSLSFVPSAAARGSIVSARLLLEDEQLSVLPRGSGAGTFSVKSTLCALKTTAFDGRS